MSVSIRPGTPADHEAVRALLVAAFGEPDEARLVDLLRASAGYAPEYDLVAEDDAAVVGHVMLTRVPLYQPDGATRPDSGRRILCLAPLAVHPDRHGRGVGRALTEYALRLADQRGEPVVTLEGDPALYRRFGFEPASRYGLVRPSPTVPEPAYQVAVLSSYQPSLRGQVSYPTAFWAASGSGLPEVVAPSGPFAVPWLFQLARYAGWIESATTSGDLHQPVPACPGWRAVDLLGHLDTVYRRVVAWIREGRRPRDPAPDTPAKAGDHATRRADLAWARFTASWRDLFVVLAGSPPETPAATWSPWDATIGFWRRRMAHETAIHAYDVLDAVGADSSQWTVTDEVALDGVDEALRLWLGTRLAGQVGGDGGLVQVVAGDQAWTVGLHGHIAEVHRLATPAEARLEGAPAAVYAWLWGRGRRDRVPATGHDTSVSGGSVPVAGDGVRISGDVAAVAALRRALDRAMG